MNLQKNWELSQVLPVVPRLVEVAAQSIGIHAARSQHVQIVGPAQFFQDRLFQGGMATRFHFGQQPLFDVFRQGQLHCHPGIISRAMI